MLTRKIITLFQIEEKSLPPACKIYEGICICGQKYIGGTKKNVDIRWMERNTPSVKSNPAKHLTDNVDPSFTWKVICNVPNRKLARKILKAYFIATMKPSLNDKIDSDVSFYIIVALTVKNIFEKLSLNKNLNTCFYLQSTRLLFFQAHI